MTQGRLVRLLRFRDRDRDAERDERRLAPLRVAIRSALASVDAERDGLARRVEDLRGWAADLMGTEPAPEGAREALDERDLIQAERLLLAGDHRLERVTEMGDLLRTMERFLLDADATARGRAFKPPPRPAASA